MVIIILLCGVSLVDGEVKKTEPDEIIYEAEEPVYVEYYENGIFTNSQDWVLRGLFLLLRIFYNSYYGEKTIRWLMAMGL